MGMFISIGFSSNVGIEEGSPAQARGIRIPPMKMETNRLFRFIACAYKNISGYWASELFEKERFALCSDQLSLLGEENFQLALSQKRKP
jgi:hypothetical protein